MKGCRRTRSLVLAAGALALFPSLADAGPWNRRSGGFYAKLGYNHLRATELATPAGEVVDIPAYLKDEATLYAEYGLSDRFAAVVDLTATGGGDRGLRVRGGIGDLRLALQWQVAHRGASVFALRGTVQAPTGDGRWAPACCRRARRVGRTSSPRRASPVEGQGWPRLVSARSSDGGGLCATTASTTRRSVGASSDQCSSSSACGRAALDTEPGDRRPSRGLRRRRHHLAWGPGLIVEVARGIALQLDVDGATHVRNIAKRPTGRFGLSVSR
jgi:hypothetical protein